MNRHMLSRHTFPQRYATCKTRALQFLAAGLLVLSSLSPASAGQPDHVILVILEGIGKDAILSGSMPNIAELADNGAVTWEVESVLPPQTVPAMATLLTGLPVKRHRISASWEKYDFARSFMRSPTVFDYMDLAAGKDSAVFFMDERLYQLSRPEIYVDSQMCGMAKPQCNPGTIAGYVRDYLRKVTSPKGYGFRLIAVPNLLLVHLPTASRSGSKYGWDSERYAQSLQAIDTAIGKIRENYRELGVLDQTMFFITGLNTTPAASTAPGKSSAVHAGKADTAIRGHRVPWILSGNNVKRGYTIKNAVSLIDTGATIMYALGLKTHTEWESHAIDEIFESVPELRTTENEEPASLY